MSVVALAKVETHDLLRRAAAPGVRLLMILVAIVGLSLGAGLWGSKLWVRHKEAERWASHHAGESMRWSNRTDAANVGPDRVDAVGSIRAPSAEAASG
jgi:hypothetical protein